ncbi:MAG: DUF2779 domain-containing protein [Candidatus Izimaplasma sp.]|nr:DUF2779 domain-containing protein [Candidatus Izimaplasma bacterium]
MSNMNITKSKFMEFIRCNRFPALNNIHKRRDLDDALMDRYYDLLDSLENANDSVYEENFLEPDLTHLEVMMPYFTKVEVLAAEKVKSLFGGETKFGTDYGTQKLFLRDFNNFNLMCYVDIYNNNKDNISIIEAKATTSNKFMKLGYTENKIRHNLFYLGEDDILRLNELHDPSLLSNPKYIKQRNKLFDRLDGAGVYVYDLAFQRFVIEDKTKDAAYYLAVLNHEYVFDGQYEGEEPLYTNDIIRFVDLTRITLEMQSRIEADIATVVERIINDDESRVKLGKHCQLKKMRECIYKDLCYDMFPKKNSILMYMNKHNGFKDPDNVKHDYFDLIDEGYKSMEDIPDSWLTRKNNRIQRHVAQTKKVHLDEGKIRAAVETIQYPIYHLDFESFPCPLPRFKGEKPYYQSLFQFSLHIEKEPGVCNKENDHYEFLASDSTDQRLELVKKLCEYIIDDGGSVLVYNEAFEKTRIKELAVMYPKYSEKLLSINERLFDLLHIVKTNTKLFIALGFNEERAKTINYYHEDLAGSFSIKKVLPLFSDLTYQGMPVGNGMEAVYAYAGFKNLNPKELEITRNNLKLYCQQDTWAMVEILDKLRKI